MKKIIRKQTLFFIIMSILVSVKAYSSELESLNWVTEPGSYPIVESKANITIKQNEYLVTGEDALEYMFLMQGHREYKTNAAVYRVDGPEAGTQVLYTINSIGYLSKNDWEDTIDTGEMLDEIKRGTREANKVRAEGFADLYVDGWAQSPYLDKVNNIVFWAISGHDSVGNHFVNAKALKLGREGYTEIIWIGSPDQFTSSETVLMPILENYTYSEGFQYQDYIPGTDKVAAAGVGALVYKLATGKAAAKVGLLALVAVFAKKFWFIFLLPFMFLWGVIKRKIFTKKEV